MPAFSITPFAGFTPPAPDDFPQQIQFRWNGVDLGGPDATVVDFVGAGVTAERGTGDDAGTITVTIS